MANTIKASPKEEKTKFRLIVRLTVPMLLLVLFQIAFFCIAMTIGGEFSYVRQYAYGRLEEKTESREGYIRSELQQKMPYVQETSERINRLIMRILLEQNASIDDLQTNRGLNRLIVESSVESLIDLLRRSRVNDVYLILETGSLYSENDSNQAKLALYLRDLDTTGDMKYEDLLMKIGDASISQEYGIALDSDWTVHFEPDPEDMTNFDFYYTTLQTAKENNTQMQENLGYWSGFSKHSDPATSSMKYTVPLMAGDGTIYGVIGIGLTEDTILTNLPSNDFTTIKGCYVLGHSRTDDQFEIVTHAGTEFENLVGNEDTLRISNVSDDHICEFPMNPEVDLVGSIHYMNLYNQRSPYYEERWVVISVADRASVLSPLTGLVNYMIVSAMITLAVSIVVVILICRAVVKPIAATIKTINSNREYGQVVHFQPTNIYELDKMTDAITQLQIHVQDYSSQVSKMIRIADVGLGTFLYDRINDSVFVGQSLFKLLRLQTQQDEDLMMSRREFIANIIAEETRLAIAESLEMLPDEKQTDYVKEYCVAKEDGTTLWMRLTLVYDKNKSIGILQNITGEMMEKKQIEYERDYDGITGLLNRKAYHRRVGELFLNKSELKITAFIMIDLDNLKYVNDTYGHDFGDDYIKTAATVLKKFQDYGGIVSRLSGDEFNVCLPGFSSRDEIWSIINEVRDQLLQSYCLLADGKHYKIRASAGIAWYPDDAKTYEMLMKYADFAMYTVKHSTKGRLAEFDKNVYSMDAVLLTGVEEMNRIIDECSIRYAFQSIISASTGEIYGYEALLRPQSTIFQSPLELLRTAKAGARLYEIERLTWTRALDEFQAQIDAGNIAKDCHIFINSIPDNVLNAADADTIEETYPELLSQIVLEVQENANVSEEYNTRKIRRMKKWNAQIALDDFGTGYNNEYALITIQPNIIKIARSIVSGCDKDKSRSMVINNLVKIAQAKQALVVAEGVETEGELETVIACGVDLLQGYYFSRPLLEPQPLAPEIAEQIKRLSRSKVLLDKYP